MCRAFNIDKQVDDLEVASPISTGDIPSRET